MRKRATANEVAKAAGVSKWTVIRAFTPGASIANASRQKVLAAAKALHYSPNLLARSLATNLTHQVAILVDDFTNPHKLPFLERLTALLQAEGRVAILININASNDHVSAILNAEQRQVDAIIVFGTSFEEDSFQNNRFTKSFPDVYLLARDSQNDMMTSINCDTEKAIQEICGHLEKFNYKLPCFMSGPKTISTALGRHRYFTGFWARKLGHPIHEIRADRYSAASGGDSIRAFLQGNHKIDLIMCENDILACGTKDVIVHEFGLRVPQDIAVVGFDNIALSAAPPYNLTTYEQPTHQMAAATVDMILGRVAKKPLAFQGSLVVRGSTR